MTRTLKTAVLATGMVALMAGVAQADHIPDGRKVHKLVFQVNVEDQLIWNLTLNNITNVITEVGKENVEIKLVTYRWTTRSAPTRCAA